MMTIIQNRNLFDFLKSYSFFLNDYFEKYPQFP